MKSKFILNTTCYWHEVYWFRPQYLCLGVWLESVVENIDMVICPKLSGVTWENLELLGSTLYFLSLYNNNKIIILFLFFNHLKTFSLFLSIWLV